MESWKKQWGDELHPFPLLPRLFWIKSSKSTFHLVCFVLSPGGKTQNHPHCEKAVEQMPSENTGHCFKSYSCKISCLVSPSISPETSTGPPQICCASTLVLIYMTSVFFYTGKSHEIWSSWETKKNLWSLKASPKQTSKKPNGFELNCHISDRGQGI